jgi:protein-tyrosine phosphatase
MVEWLLHRGAVHVIASDAHNLDRRPPIMSKARDLVAEIVGAEAAEALVTGNPAAIVDGEPIPVVVSS